MTVLMVVEMDVGDRDGYDDEGDVNQGKP